MRRVENLVHATNSALAQMKFSLMFDDAGGEMGGGDLRQCQEEFRSEANEMLSKMEKMLGSSEASRKNSKALERIKEINRKMNTIRQERGKPKETEQSRQKLMSLIAEEKSIPEKPDRLALHPGPDPLPLRVKDAHPPEVPRRPSRKTDALPLSDSPAKSKEELRNKILETREIVDRGFHTARQLAQKVDSMTKNERKEKTPGSEKAVSEANVRSSDGKSESERTGKSVRCGRHRRKEEKEEREAVPEVPEKERENTRVVNVRQRECRRSRRPRLRLQRLPSVHIRGGLQLQKVHNLEIPASGDESRGKTNTGFCVLSHEQIEKVKMERVLEGVRRENCCCSEEPGGVGNYVECTNCGKVMRVHIPKSAVDPRKVDDILKKCNFNVFDPRIDEFVEKYGAVDAQKRCETEPEAGVPEGSIHAVETELEEKTEIKKKRKQEKKKEATREARHFSLKDLSNRLSNKYREEADTLEGTHLQLDSLLRTLLRKIDETREVFEGCHLFKNERVLTATKPVVVSLTESSSRSRKKEKLDKKDVKNRSKSRTEEAKEVFLSSLSESSEEKEAVRIALFPEEENESRKRKLSQRESERVREKSRSRRRFRRSTTEEKPQSPTSTSSCQSISPNRLRVVLGRSSVKATEGREEEWKDGGREARETEKEIVAPSPEPPGEKETALDDASVRTGSSRGSEKRGVRAEVADGKRSPTSSGKKNGSEGGEVEKMRSAAESSGDEEKAPSEASSYKSENNYESDFESAANEPDEEPEPEVVACSKKLSTISEVDSELERKVSEGQKTQSSSQDGDALPEEPQGDVLRNHHRSKLDAPEPKKSSSHASEVSAKSRRAEDTPPKTGDASLRSTSTELVTSLKDILSALKDQFARTETLAEKLTENAKQEKAERREEGEQSPWRMLEGLRSARRERAEEGSPSKEDGLSLGEVAAGGRRRGGSSSEGSLLKSGVSRRSSRGEAKNANSEEVSYSEGEIPSDVLLDSDCCSSHSVGEIHF